MKLLEDLKEGWTFRTKNKASGKWRSQKKFHYFKNNRSLCSVYEIEENQTLLSDDTLQRDDVCLKCLNKKVRIIH